LRPFLFGKEFNSNFVTTNPFLSVSLSVSFAGWRETQTKEDDKMSDEGMMTMDEDEEIGQVSFVDYIYVLCFPLSFDRRDGGEMITISSSSSSSSLVVSTSRCCANCQITRNSSFVHVCEKRERERERDVSRSLSSKERTTINPMSEDGSLSLNVSLCFSFLFFLSLSLGRAYYVVDDRNN
jgi:hypothetical protein